MKNKLPVLTLLFIMSFTLTACTLGDLPVIGKFFGKPSTSANLTFWGLWENPDVMSSIISKYKESHPGINIVYEDRSILKPADYRERVFTRADNNVGADVVLLHSSWISKLKDSLSPMPSKLMTAKAYQENFYPAAFQSGVFDGKIYAVPFYYDGLVLLYNKDHFAEIGQQEPPTAWEEFRRLALRLTIRSGEGDKQVLVRSGAAMGLADNIEHFGDIMGLLFSQTDVAIPQDLGTKAASDAMDFYVNFSKEDKVWDETMPEANIAFAQGKTSMILVPTWRIVDILAANPKLNFGVAPVPQAIPDNPTSWGSFWMLAVPSSSKDPAAAWDFINFVASKDEELARYSEASKYRPFGAPFANTSLMDQAKDNMYVYPVLETAPFSRTGEVASRVGNTKVTDGLVEAIKAVYTKAASSSDALQNFINGTPQPELYK